MESRRKQLTGLRPQTYEHPTDSSLLNALQMQGKLQLVVRKLNEWGWERIIRVNLTGSYLCATKDGFPELHAVLREACHNLDLPIIPELYIAPGPINAYTSGVERPLILINADAIDSLTDDELLFVIGHEVGHIKSGHVLYSQVAEFFPMLAEIIGGVTFGIGELLGAGLHMALVRWQRMAEFTADRAGLLACQDAETAIRTLTKISGLPRKNYETANTEDFIAQAKAFQAMDIDKLALVAKWFSSIGETHPWTVMRGQELINWIDSGNYDRVLGAPQAIQGLPPVLTGPCPDCGHSLRGVEKFCPGCGKSMEEAHVHAR